MASQTFPFPEPLERVVAAVEYRPGWHLHLGDAERDIDDATGEVLSAGLTLTVVTSGFNSYHPDRGPHYSVHHYFPVPPATYTFEDWRRWVFDRLVDVERHEAAEFFAVDGEHPYAPTHGPGRNPYTVTEYRAEIDRRTRPDGSVVP